MRRDDRIENLQRLLVYSVKLRNFAYILSKMTQKRIALVGSTGSIGVQTLDIVSEYPEQFGVKLLSAGHNVELLIEQSIKFRPEIAVIADETKYSALREALTPYGIDTAAGSDSLADAMESRDYDLAVIATVGYSGLEPTLRAIKAHRDIALANKETLVVAGELVTSLLKQSQSDLMPIDSEHSAIYQSLAGEDRSKIKRLLITASGGPFRTKTRDELKTVTVKDALHHPNWSMGAKITIDSATMVNKAFEIIEARWLFDVPASKIKAVVHPQSIVHSMVEFVDGAVKAQLGVPDMRIPISYALGNAVRLSTARKGLTIADYARLEFFEPDTGRFPLLNLAYYALERGGNTACVINAANEIAVEAFLHEKIPFTDIQRIIESSLEKIDFISTPSYEDYVATNAETRHYAGSLLNR